MSQKISPFLESKWGWEYGESGWNLGMDENLLKFSFMFDGNIDSIESSLPPAVNGKAHFLTTDNRLYFAVGNSWYSSPCPKNFIFKDRLSGDFYQFNGTSVIPVSSPTEQDTRVSALEGAFGSLGTAAYEDTTYFATQDNLGVATAQSFSYTDELRNDLSGADGSTLVSFNELRTVEEKLSDIASPADTNAASKSGPIIFVSEGNWTEQGGRVYFFNPDAVDIQSTLKNSVVVLGGRGDTGYRVTVGPNAELAFHGGGGDTLLDHLAGTVCGGAHHKMTKNNAATPTGSHGFIGGGSYQEVYGDYAVVVGGTLNTNHAIKAAIVGGDSNRIGNINDGSVGRNSFVGGGYLNTIDGQYAWIPSGQLCKAQKDYSSAWGYSATSNLYGTMASSSGKFSVDGDNNTLRGKLRRVTTSAVATQLLLDGSSETLTMGSNTLWSARVLISALRTDTVETASYSLTFSAYRDSSGVVTIKSQSLAVMHEDNASYTVDVIASGASVQIRATGVASSTIRWSASFEIDELRNI